MTKSISARTRPASSQHRPKTSTTARSKQNPLLARWSTAFGAPPFAKIETKHFRTALNAAFREHKA